MTNMAANNKDPLAAQLYAAIGLSHFVSMRDLDSTMIRLIYCLNRLSVKYMDISHTSLLYIIYEP
jgi:hypothetical protein